MAGAVEWRRPESEGGDGGARLRLIEATAQIMRDEGYAAATSRRVAARAGVKQALVYYYFPTMDDLFVEVLKVGADVALAQMRTAFDGRRPDPRALADQQRCATDGASTQNSWHLPTTAR